MSKNTLREDKTCLNCNYVVEKKFCPNCGQENIDTRKTFYQLFVHFFEDLTHYENSFWKTIRNLLLKPASLTKEYLSGKRMSYLAPIRLYIFISFATFFLLSVIPDNEDTPDVKVNSKKVLVATKKKEKDTIFKEQEKIIKLEQLGLLTKTESDSLQKLFIQTKLKQIKDKKNNFTLLGSSYNSVEELDSLQKHGKPSEKLGAFEYWITRKMQLVNDKYDSDELKEKFAESFIHNLPKSLFIYMPLFALVLWLFQNKKKWYYFDHGIFTLHYFSFLLLAILILRIINYLFEFINDYTFFNILEYIFATVAILYMFYYFFPAHHRFYGESRVVSACKGIAMFIINIIFIVIILSVMAIYTFINIH
ncbi:MAG: DUF3667 domain-containing protein [Flavobacterium sp.]|uniref:DUF3667 domain-containing protein n=1 Tax=Flavobacterium sp. TaxID=239 RepID=UPI00352851CD